MGLTFVFVISCVFIFTKNLQRLENIHMQISFVQFRLESKETQGESKGFFWPNDIPKLAVDEAPSSKVNEEISC